LERRLGLEDDEAGLEGRDGAIISLRYKKKQFMEIGGCKKLHTIGADALGIGGK